MMTLAHAHQLMQSRMTAGDTCTLVGNGQILLSRVHTDTRSLQAGDLFVALKGEQFDAHQFLAQAQAQGASAAVAERGLHEAGLPGLLVSDTRRALGALAAAWRAQFDLPVIAVTGSNGKTTVTQMIASILRAWVGEATLATQGNLNNDIGVPLTLLHLRAEHRAAVVELGMNHPDEIAGLAAMAAPSVALVNNAQREHQEFMATVEAVALENGAVIQALPESGVAVFPADDEFTPLWRALSASRHTCIFAVASSADVSGNAQWVSAQADIGPHWAMLLRTPAGESRVRLQVAGRHNVKNALAACAAALSTGCPLDAVQRGLEHFEPVKGRSQLKAYTRGSRRVTLVDDSYNANPDSVRAAIDVLADLPGPRWLLLGDMGEVGDQGPAFHREVGAYARELGIETLWTAGAASSEAARAFDGARHFDTVVELLAALPQGPGAASVVVKGSRFMKMEQVVNALIQTSPHVSGAPHAD
jgi:UDP-N-acetylmuramoyl-tripeptide--D-alanyl-D-alanine ligase